MMEQIALPNSVLLLTMPGFGAQTLSHLARTPQWARIGVSVALVGDRPSTWRWLAAGMRRACQRPEDRLHSLADGTWSSRGAERLLRTLGVPWCWLATDEAVRRHRLSTRPALTLTLTSRVLFSARTLQEPGGDWLNVHPGLLPDYAGAAPGPYMFMDDVGGCTIHRMVQQVDAGDVIDKAPMSGPLGQDVAEYFFERLPIHTAGRIAALLERWLAGEPLTPLAEAPRRLRHCSSARLAADRQLDWSRPSGELQRWVAALAAMAPAWWLDSASKVTEVMAAVVRDNVADNPPGTVLKVDRRWVEVACAQGAIALRCRSRPRVTVGQVLPARTVAAT